MSGLFVLSPSAQRDLGTIWDDTMKRWGVAQAERYIRQLWQSIETIAAQPAIGRECFVIRKGYYKFPSGSHFIFYRVMDNGIDIVRILHERMDFEHHV